MTHLPISSGADFLTFLSVCYGLRIQDASEVPHFLTFLEHVVDRPVSFHRGGRKEYPIRKTIGTRIRALQTHLRRRRCHFQLSSISIQYADELSRPYRRSRPGARSVRREHVEKLCLSLDESKPRQLRLKAVTLIVWHAWARPKEILSRIYPRDIDATHRGGIVIIVSESKTNDGERPEFSLLRMTPMKLCVPFVACVNGSRGSDQHTQAHYFRHWTMTAP